MQERQDQDPPLSRTREAETILRDADGYEEGIERIRGVLMGDTIREYFAALLDRHGLTVAEAVKRADLDKDFGRQILIGERMARRDYYIRLAIGMGLSFPETQSMLNFVGHGPIYAVRERDAAVLYAIQRGYNLMQTQYLLDEHDLPVLGDPDPETGGYSDPLSTHEAEYQVREAQDFGELREEIGDFFVRASVNEYFETMLSARGMSRAQALERAGIKQSIGFQLLNGTRTAKNRDVYVRLALALSLTLDDTQRMLKFLKKGELYPLRERDAALVFCLAHGYSIEETNRLLLDNGLGEL